MTELFTNNAASTLASSVAAIDTAITVQSGHGARFPSPSGSDFFRVTLFKKSTGDIEICKCTSRSGDVLTVTRAQESTTALALSSGDIVELRPTAGFFEDLSSGLASIITTGTGLLAKTGAGAFTGREIAVDTDDLQVANEDGLSGNPTLALAFSVSTFIKSLLDDMSAAAARATLELPSFASGTESITLSTAGTQDFTITHGLGTDDVDVDWWLEGPELAFGQVTYSVSRTPNDVWKFQHVPNYGSGWVGPAQPSTGDVVIRVAAAGSINGMVLHYTVRTR